MSDFIPADERKEMLRDCNDVRHPTEGDTARAAIRSLLDHADAADEEIDRLHGIILEMSRRTKDEIATLKEVG